MLKNETISVFTRDMQFEPFWSLQDHQMKTSVRNKK